MIQVLRQEKKYLLTLQEATAEIGFLQQIMNPDPHNGPDGYPIRSLYFDTLADGDYFDKVDGIEVRRKLRLRCYAADSPFAMLEMKQKHGEQQLKRSLRVTRTEGERLCSGDYSPLLAYEEPFAAECYALLQTRCYRPRALVEYRRTAFVSPVNNTRLTFDRQIRASESRFDLFADDLCLHPVFEPSHVVMEVKYNGFLLSYIKQAVDRIDRRELSVGKYAQGRSISYGSEF